MRFKFSRQVACCWRSVMSGCLQTAVPTVWAVEQDGSSCLMRTSMMRYTRAGQFISMDLESKSADPVDRH